MTLQQQEEEISLQRRPSAGSLVEEGKTSPAGLQLSIIEARTAG